MKSNFNFSESICPSNGSVNRQSVGDEKERQSVGDEKEFREGEKCFWEEERTKERVRVVGGESVDGEGGGVTFRERKASDYSSACPSVSSAGR